MTHLHALGLTECQFASVLLKPSVAERKIPVGELREKMTQPDNLKGQSGPGNGRTVVLANPDGSRTLNQSRLILIGLNNENLESDIRG